MTDKEIKTRLKEFSKAIFRMKPSEADEIKKQLDDFCNENNVTVEQLQEFAESGAGEMLYLMTC